MEEEIVQEHVYILEKAPGVGFGIAISGGKDNPGATTGDPAIIISDVIKGGPAFDKLKINDVVLRVNGKPMYNIEHAKAVRELKNSGHRVELKIKRKVVVQVTPPSHRGREMESYRRRSRSRHGSRGRDWDDSRRRQRSRSRDLDSVRGRRQSRRRSRSSSRGRSYSRSPPRRSYSRSRTPSYRRGYSRSRSRSPSYARGRSRSRTPPPRRRSPSPYSSRTPSPARHDRSRMDNHRSVGDLRDAVSPLSPDPDSANFDPEMMVFPVKKREPKTVVLKKTKQNNSYGLKLGTRIFIQDIQPGSLADKSLDITSGDTVLMINGRNVDNKTVQEAIQIIGLSRDKVTMLVKKEDGGTVSLPASRFRSPGRDSREDVRRDEPRRHSRHGHSRKSSTSKASSRSAARSSTSAPKRATRSADKKQSGGIKVLPTLTPAPRARSSSSSSRSTPEPAPRSKHDTPDREYAVPPGSDDDDEEPILPPSARQITFVKGKNVGIRLAGGNDVGIFVASVQDGSPAAKKGLKMGDQILSVNDVNFRNIVREEAVLTLMGLPVGDEVKIIAQPQAETYKKVLEMGTGDSFYIRTHIKYEKNGQHELSFRKGSAFRISDTLYQGMVGYWLAVRIGRNNMEIERGVIPNRSRAEQMKMVQDKKMMQMRERSNRGISRRIKNQKSDTPLPSATSSMFPAYERVVLREAGFKRPVVIFGPLADVARERLAGDYFNLYEIARNEGVVRGQKSNRKGVIRMNTIKDIIEQEKHAILDITPTAVEKLNYAQLYPIVVFLEAPNKAAVKELRSKLATTEAEKKKKAGKLFDRANKLQRGYSHVFTDTIRLDDSDNWYRKIHSTIKDQQSMPVWVSKDKLGGAGDEAEEGITVPGDDDQLSYVSAPASDYSVTTVGSDTLNHSRVSEDYNDQPLPVVAKPPSSSSEEADGKQFGDDDFDDSNESDAEPPVDKVVAPAVSKPISAAPAKKLEPKYHAQPKPQPVRQPSSTSSSSSDEPQTPNITPQSPNSYHSSRAEPPRGGQEIPQGRFDPQSFLKSHIQGLKPVSKEDDSSTPVSASTYRKEPAASRAQPNYNSPPVEKAAPQQAVYAQVDKSRPRQQSHEYRDRREPSGSGRDFNNYQTNEPYKSASSRLMDDRPPVRQEPTRHVPPTQTRPTYNRFAGSTQAKVESKPYQSNNPPQSYQRPPVTNGVPQKSNFVPDRRNPVPADPYTNPRPLSHPSASKLKPGSKEQMYDSGVDTYYNAKPKKESAPVSPTLGDDDDPQVVATARGVFDTNGGVLSSVETGVSIVIPKGAIRPGVRQEIYFKVCRDNTALPPLDKNKGETLLSPLVMCGPHGLQFDHPVELRLPHSEPSQWSGEGDNYEGGGNSVSVLIDHF